VFDAEVVGTISLWLPAPSSSNAYRLCLDAARNDLHIGALKSKVSGTMDHAVVYDGL